MHDIQHLCPHTHIHTHYNVTNYVGENLHTSLSVSLTAITHRPDMPDRRKLVWIVIACCTTAHDVHCQWQVRLTHSAVNNEARARRTFKISYMKDVVACAKQIDELKKKKGYEALKEQV